MTVELRTANELRKERRMLTDIPDENFLPGSFGCHEAMHLASVFRDIIEAHLAEHPAVKAKPEWTALAETATTALFDLYQAIAAEHMDACPEGWRSVES